MREQTGNPVLRGRARELRRELTPAERILWPRLRGRRFLGFKFRRQHPFGRYVLDFFCHESSIVVELDGLTHVGREAQDKRRQRWIESRGLKVLRFWDSDVYTNLNGVLEVIWHECDSRKAKVKRPPPKRNGPHP